MKSQKITSALCKIKLKYYFGILIFGLISFYLFNSIQIYTKLHKVKQILPDLIRTRYNSKSVKIRKISVRNSLISYRFLPRGNLSTNVDLENLVIYLNVNRFSSKWAAEDHFEFNYRMKRLNAKKVEGAIGEKYFYQDIETYRDTKGDLDMKSFAFHGYFFMKRNVNVVVMSCYFRNPVTYKEANDCITIEENLAASMDGILKDL